MQQNIDTNINSNANAKTRIKLQSSSSNKKGVSSIALIGIILIIAVVGLCIIIFFERYIAPFLANKVLLRIILLGVLINLCILIFLVYSFSRVQFQQGPRGPSGIRGLIGPLGSNSQINKCSKQTKTITKEYNDRIRAKTIIIQQPAIELP